MNVTAVTHAVEWSVENRVFRFSRRNSVGELLTPDGQILLLSVAEWQTLVRVLSGDIPSLGPEPPSFSIPRQEKVLFGALGAPNHGEPWTEVLDRRLADCWQSTNDIRKLMNEFGRTRGGIKSRLKKLGLAQDKDFVDETNF